MQPMPCWEAFATFLHSFIWFFYSLSWICQWELPSANTFFSTVCWSSRGLCSKARQERGKTVQQREDGVSPSSSPAGLRRAGIQTRNLQIDDFPQPPPQATACLPEGLCDSGAPEKCLWPWKKKKSADIPHSREFKQVWAPVLSRPSGDYTPNEAGRTRGKLCSWCSVHRVTADWFQTSCWWRRL